MTVRSRRGSRLAAGVAAGVLLVSTTIPVLAHDRPNNADPNAEDHHPALDFNPDDLGEYDNLEQIRFDSLLLTDNPTYWTTTFPPTHDLFRLADAVNDYPAGFIDPADYVEDAEDIEKLLDLIRTGGGSSTTFWGAAEHVCLNKMWTFGTGGLLGSSSADHKVFEDIWLNSYARVLGRGAASYRLPSTFINEFVAEARSPDHLKYEGFSGAYNTVPINYRILTNTGLPRYDQSSFHTEVLPYHIHDAALEIWGATGEAEEDVAAANAMTEAYRADREGTLTDGQDTRLDDSLNLYLQARSVGDFSYMTTDDKVVPGRPGECTEGLLRIWLAALLYDLASLAIDETSDHPVRRNDKEIRQKLVADGAAQNVIDDIGWASVIMGLYLPDARLDTPDGRDARDGQIQSRTCPLSDDQTIRDAVGTTSTEHPDERLPELDVLYKELMEADMLILHGLARGFGCRTDVIAAWVAQMLDIQKQYNKDPNAPIVVSVASSSDHSVDLLYGDIGPPVNRWNIRGHVTAGDFFTNLLEWPTTLSTTFAFAFTAWIGEFAANQTVNVFDLDILTGAATTVDSLAKQLSARATPAGAAFRVLVMLLAAWTAWQVLRKQSILKATREVLLSLVLVVGITIIATNYLGTIVKTTADVTSGAVSYLAGTLIGTGDCILYYGHADKLHITAIGNMSLSEKDMWECQDEPKNPVPDELRERFERENLTVPVWGVISGTTCLWGDQTVVGLERNTDFQHVPADAGQKLRELCVVRHLIKDTLVMEPSNRINYNTSFLSHSPSSGIESAAMSGHKCANVADIIAFRFNASPTDTETIVDEGETPITAFGNANTALGCGLADVNDLFTNHVYKIGMSRTVETFGSVLTAGISILFLGLIFLTSIFGQVGFLAGIVVSPIMGMLAILPGKTRQMMWRWVQHLIRMVVCIFGAAAILIVFFFLLKLTNALAEATIGPAWLNRLLYMGVLAYFTWKAWRSLADTTRKWSHDHTAKIKAAIEKTTGVTGERDDPLSQRLAKSEAKYDKDAEAARTARVAKRATLRKAVSGGLRQRFYKPDGRAAGLGFSLDPATGKTRWSSAAFAKKAADRANQRVKDTGEAPSKLEKAWLAGTKSVDLGRKARDLHNTVVEGNTQQGIQAIAQLLGYETPDSALSDAERAKKATSEATQKDPHWIAGDDRTAETAAESTASLRQAQEKLTEAARLQAAIPSKQNRQAYIDQISAVRSALGAGATANPDLVDMVLAGDDDSILGEHRDQIAASLVVSDGLSDSDRYALAQVSVEADNALRLMDVGVGPATPVGADADSSNSWARMAAAQVANPEQLLAMAEAGEQSNRVQRAILSRSSHLSTAGHLTSEDRQHLVRMITSGRS